MTPIHRDLTALGFACLETEGDKTAGLKWVEGGVGLFVALKVGAGVATWEHQREFRGDAGLQEAKAALLLWKLTQVAANRAAQVADLD